MQYMVRGSIIALFKKRKYLKRTASIDNRHVVLRCVPSGRTDLVTGAAVVWLLLLYSNFVDEMLMKFQRAFCRVKPTECI